METNFDLLLFIITVLASDCFSYCYPIIVFGYTLCWLHVYAQVLSTMKQHLSLPNCEMCLLPHAATDFFMACEVYDMNTLDVLVFDYLKPLLPLQIIVVLVFVGYILLSHSSLLLLYKTKGMFLDN